MTTGYRYHQDLTKNKIGFGKTGPSQTSTYHSDRLSDEVIPPPLRRRSLRPPLIKDAGRSLPARDQIVIAEEPAAIHSRPIARRRQFRKDGDHRGFIRAARCSCSESCSGMCSCSSGRDRRHAKVPHADGAEDKGRCEDVSGARALGLDRARGTSVVEGTHRNAGDAGECGDLTEPAPRGGVGHVDSAAKAGGEEDVVGRVDGPRRQNV